MKGVKGDEKPLPSRLRSFDLYTCSKVKGVKGVETPIFLTCINKMRVHVPIIRIYALNVLFPAI